MLFDMRAAANFEQRSGRIRAGKLNERVGDDDELDELQMSANFSRSIRRRRLTRSGKQTI